MSQVFNFSRYTVCGARFNLDHKRNDRTIHSSHTEGVLELMAQIKAIEGFDPEQVIIVPHPDSSFHTLFLSEWLRVFGRKGSIALNVSANTGTIMVSQLGQISTIGFLIPSF